MVAPPRPLPRRQARHALVAWPRGRRLPRSRHRPVVLCRQHTACRADQPLVREAGRLSCPHQPFLVSPQQHNLLHTFCPTPTLPTLCTSANGAAKVTARFLDGGQDRRRIGQIRFPSELEGVAHALGDECCHTMTVAVTAYLALHSPASLLKCCTNFYSTCWHNKEPKNMKQHFFKGALGSQMYLRRRPTVLFVARVNSQNI